MTYISQTIFTPEDYPESLSHPYPILISLAMFHSGSMTGRGKGDLGRRHLPDGYAVADSRPWSYTVTAILSTILMTFPFCRMLYDRMKRPCLSASKLHCAKEEREMENTSSTLPFHPRTEGLQEGLGEFLLGLVGQKCPAATVSS